MPKLNSIFRTRRYSLASLRPTSNLKRITRIPFSTFFLFITRQLGIWSCMWVKHVVGAPHQSNATMNRYQVNDKARGTYHNVTHHALLFACRFSLLFLQPYQSPVPIWYRYVFYTYMEKYFFLAEQILCRHFEMHRRFIVDVIYFMFIINHVSWQSH